MTVDQARRHRWGTLIGLGLIVIPACWYLSLAAHEAGHAAAGEVTGCTRIQTRLPLLGFSETIRSPDPHELLTTAAGPIAGCVIPLVLWGVARAARLPGRPVLRFWAGFALVLNGTYIGVDAWIRGADGGQMVRAGAPAWVLMVLGGSAAAGGLWVWHGMEKRESGSGGAIAETMVGVAMLAVGLVGVALV